MMMIVIFDTQKFVGIIVIIKNAVLKETAIMNAVILNYSIIS